MQLYTLLKQTPVYQLDQYVRQLKPDWPLDKPAFRRWRDRLLAVGPAESELQITVTRDFWPVDVTGIRPDGERLSLVATDWALWLGSRIHPDTLRRYRPGFIAAACVWEMTWTGFERPAPQQFLDQLSGCNEGD